MNFIAGFAGMRYAELLTEILEAAQTRIASERKLRKVTGEAQGMTESPKTATESLRAIEWRRRRGGSGGLMSPIQTTS